MLSLDTFQRHCRVSISGKIIAQQFIYSEPTFCSFYSIIMGKVCSKNAWWSECESGHRYMSFCAGSQPSDGVHNGGTGTFRVWSLQLSYLWAGKPLYQLPKQKLSETSIFQMSYLFWTNLALAQTWKAIQRLQQGSQKWAKQISES